ncbi:sulfite exporter TauE/SafE family protein [Nesterenkonia sp. LB17]|uniref:TSUP family transporter n=1 Tax=unclassified Nesterenkonia TaxID=2629769 RepID=UPI001F4CD83D|nr:sulfite exporter TauE/SafE family protein [Nesterenkonia sp. DZ6]MCH8562925.1 sulfite exporter TauE/SafE family protein [Nesterenkonia sp. YGD6]MCH8565963.1 sulfite exporter TauE/SafE family protein [Nesterenkonia sp. LB17]MCH8570755.1 sulfite exporter TauE/SafE family protein [Nesterenkonia sp. AY15]
MEALIPLAVVGLVLLAAVIQRLVGLGFGMVMAPFLVVLIGAHEGVMLVNFLSIFAPMLVLPRIWSDIEWRKVLWLGLPALAVMPAAAWISVNSSAGPLYVVVAALVIIGLITSMLLSRITFQADGATTRVIAGIGSGAGTVIAGVGGPAMTIYAVLSRWPIMSMIATLQPIWILLSLGSFGIKWSFDDGALPGLPWWAWAGSVVAIVLGIVIGEWLQRRIDEALVRRLVLILAFIGSIMALITGLRLMFG